MLNRHRLNAIRVCALADDERRKVRDLVQPLMDSVNFVTCTIELHARVM